MTSTGSDFGSTSRPDALGDLSAEVSPTQGTTRLSAQRQGQPDSPKTPVNPLVVLAYDSVKDRLKSQDTTLANLRTRSTTLLSSAAVLTTVAAAVGLLYADPADGPVLERWASWTLLALVAVNGICAMCIVWPTSDWTFVPHPGRLLEYAYANEDETTARVGMIDVIWQGVESNDAKINSRVTAVRIQVTALVAEVLVLLYALTRLQQS